VTDEALLPLIGFAVVALVDWVAVARRIRLVEYVAKPLALVLLIDVALTIDPIHPGQRAWFVGALVFGLIGDVLLMLPKQRFVEGLASFLLGHLCYIVGFAVAGTTLASAAIWIMVVLAIGIVAAWPLLQPVWREHRALFGPVLAYMGVISIMAAFAGASGVLIALGGAVLFWISDYLIGWNKFVRAFPGASLLVMVTYHLGQLGLVWSLTL